MDQRQTFESNEARLAILERLHLRRERASLLVDDEGLTRTAGQIISIKHDALAADAVIVLDSGVEFRLAQVIAVNGVFRADFSEC